MENSEPQTRIQIWHAKSDKAEGFIGQYQPEEDGYRVHTIEIGKLMVHG